MAKGYRGRRRERAEFVLSGNAHSYERFGSQDTLGEASPNVTVQWIISIRGRGHAKLAAPGSRLPNSEAGQSTTFGVLDLTLALRQL